MLPNEILEFYRRGGERTRLDDGAGRLEYLRTRDVLARVLPPPPARVLDVGGATGVYAEPLAAAGYRVHVVDPVDLHVADARTRPGITAALGDARALPVPDGSVDAVLLLGPLYHLPERDDRVQAWREAARVLRSGGPVVAATISRFASLLDGLLRGSIRDPRFRSIVESALADGVHRNVYGEPAWFTTAYFHRPDQIAAEVTAAGLSVERIVGVEGPLWPSDSRLEEILADAAFTDLMLDMLRRVESEPSLLGASAHLLTVARQTIR